MNDYDKPDCFLGAVQLSTCRGDLNLFWGDFLLWTISEQ